MQHEGCWNCGSSGERLRSKRTGIVYCADCGAAMDGLGAVTDFSVLDVEPFYSKGEDEDAMDNRTDS
jgi:ribosomal protein L37AE/L43A